MEAACHGVPCAIAPLNLAFLHFLHHPYPFFVSGSRSILVLKCLVISPCLPNSDNTELGYIHVLLPLCDSSGYTVCTSIYPTVSPPVAAAHARCSRRPLLLSGLDNLLCFYTWPTSSGGCNCLLQHPFILAP